MHMVVGSWGWGSDYISLCALQLVVAEEAIKLFCQWGAAAGVQVGVCILISDMTGALPWAWVCKVACSPLLVSCSGISDAPLEVNS